MQASFRATGAGASVARRGTLRLDMWPIVLTQLLAVSPSLTGHGALAAASPAATAPAAPGAPPDTSAGRYASEEALSRYLSARLLEQSGQLTEALGEYYRALSLDPRSGDVLVHISQLCAHLGDPSRS